MQRNRSQISRNRLTALLVLWTATACTVGDAAAQLPADAGLAIAARSDRSDRGFGDSEVKVTMISRDAAGTETTRRLTVRVLENPDENFGDKILIVFESPPDVAGTTLLSHANILTPDDQWLYLPALGRVTQITSANKTGPFAGSEFSFEDFAAQELKKFSYTLIGSEPCGALTCDVVERIPLYQDSGYSRQVGWYDRDVFQLRKVEFYDRRGDLLKTLTLGDFREYSGGIWRAHLLSMVNNQTGKSTDLEFDDYAFGQGFDPALFESSALGN